MKGVPDYETIETIAATAGDWCDRHIRQVQKRADALSARYPGTPVLGTVHKLLKRKRAPRLVMRRTCIGCTKQWKEG